MSRNRQGKLVLGLFLYLLPLHSSLVLAETLVSFSADYKTVTITHGQRTWLFYRPVTPVMTPPADGAALYVSPAGFDGNSGSKSPPFLTIIARYPAAKPRHVV